MSTESDKLYKMLCGMVDPEEEVREKYIRAPFGWPGGKDVSLAQIKPHLPYRHSFIEHCGGSGIITLNRGRTKLDVFNDRDSGVTEFYKCVADSTKFQALVDRLKLTIHSRELFIDYRKGWKQVQDDVERAAQWYLVTRHSFSQQRRNWGRATSGASLQPQMIYRSLKHFGAIHKVFQEVQVENLDLFQSFKDFDNTDAVHYFDPNYVKVASGIYEHEIKEQQQWQLCEKIMDCKGYVALSGYANEIYDSFEWDERRTWKVTVTSKAQAFTESNHKLDLDFGGRDSAEEVLWIKDNAR